jgi:hypothetical protein
VVCGLAQNTPVPCDGVAVPESCGALSQSRFRLFEEIGPEINLLTQQGEHRMGYHYEARSIEGFVQQLAVSYVPHGYLHYVTGVLPEGKDPRQVDEKLLAKYGIDVSKFVRARRKAADFANVQHLRHRRFFAILATHGRHPFFLPVSEGGEGENIQDCRETPIKFGSYAASHRGGHAHVRIELETFRELRAYFSG